jgi:predicted SnoaL-like aldol condensation-catalyzing enzyme
MCVSDGFGITVLDSLCTEIVMTLRFLILLVLFFAPAIVDAQADADDTPQEAANKQLALDFYRDLWGSDNTDRYADYVAETYVVHDIGGRKGVTEPAIEQKNIADRMWDNGEMDFELDYQVAEGDRVATRWIGHYRPDTLLGKFMFGSNAIPVINVVRIQDGKIVEFWNHRHDIDTNMRYVLVAVGLLIGLAIGLLIAMIPTAMAFRLRRKVKEAGLA